MIPRRDQMALYEKVAFRNPAQLATGASYPNQDFRPAVEKYARPAPPASKPVREKAHDESMDLASLFVFQSFELLDEQPNLIQQLSDTCRKLREERDHWKAKAEAAATNPQVPKKTESVDKRIEALRKLLARELHPDGAKLCPAEAALRTELFQALWPQIDRIAKGDGTRRD